MLEIIGIIAIIYFLGPIIVALSIRILGTLWSLFCIIVIGFAKVISVDDDYNLDEPEED